MLSLNARVDSMFEDNSLTMAQQTPNEGTWNPALRPEDTAPVATSPDQGDASDLLTTSGAQEPRLPDTTSPLKDDDLSAWDMPEEPATSHLQDAKTPSPVVNAPAALDLDTPQVASTNPDETANEKPSETLPAKGALNSVADSHAPDTQTDAQGSPIMNPTQPPSVEPAFESSEEQEDFAKLLSGSTTDTKSQPNGVEASVTESTAGGTPAPAVFESGEGQADFADLLSKGSDPGHAEADGERPPDVQSTFVEKAFDESTNDFADLLSKDAGPTQPQSDAQHGLEDHDLATFPSSEAAVQEQPSFETNTNGPPFWSNQVDGDVDSDGDDFFNQLKTQTKPIFAPPEADSRFEEGLPLLDEADPTSPDRAVRRQSTANDLFANDDDDAEGFFSSTPQPETVKEPSLHITRKSTAQVMDSVGFGIDSPVSDISAAAQLDSVLKAASSEPEAAKGQTKAPEPSEEDLAARWEAELSDVGEDDLAARWEAALDDDDDDDVLLEEDAAQTTTATQPPATTNAGPAGLNSPFQSPSNQTQPRPIPGVYTPHQPSTADLVGVPIPGGAPTSAALPPYFAQQPPRPVATRGDSFAERSKQGYKSPYDLPDDLSRPRRPMATPKPVPPKVSTGMQPPPPPNAGLSQPPPVPGVPQLGSIAPPTPTAAPPPAPKNFFEELPLPPPRSRPTSSGRYTPPNAPAAAPPAAAPLAATGLPPVSPPKNPYAPAPPPAAPTGFNGSQSSLQPPEVLDPYASTLASSAPAGPSAASRYSPKPPGSQPPAKSPSLSRYSPAPPSGSSARNRYASQPLSVPGQANLPFQPRTSSPLAYHEKVSYQPEEAQPQPSLQPSVDLSPPRERPSVNQGSPHAPQLSNGSPYGINQGGASPPVPPQQTPPKSRYAPPEYINEFAKRVAPTTSYTPAPQGAAVPPPPQASGAQAGGPPRRSQTQSPGQQITSPRGFVPSIEPLPRPASVHGGSGSPIKTANPYAPMQPPANNRATSQELDFITPTDGQQEDPLARWKGAPIFKFGFGGAVVSCFPKHIPRYSAGQTAPMIMPTLGEPKFSQLTEYLPSGDTIVQHPGPLKTKSKKKDVLAWLSSKIAAFENEVHPNIDQSRPDIQKRHEEKILLWKIMRVLVESDGVLEGSPALQASLRQVIFPNFPGPESEGLPEGVPTPTPSTLQPFALPSQPDVTDPQWAEELRNNLLQGDREKAVWAAVDRRLWGHAMIIASTMDRTFWKQVVQEFVRREVRSTTANTESLAALYEIFAGNIEESVDELVPPSARAGHHLISKADGQGAAKNALEGLESWRDTLGLVLSNRSSDDHQALLALGQLLASYDRTEAAHICFIFSRAAVFGGADDPQANIVLLGADHQRFPSSLLDEDAILLTEVYEFATTVLGTSSSGNLPYLLAFKLLHAKYLADRGSTSESQNYCDAVAAALKASTRPSPYYHQHLFAEIDELSARLRQTASDGTSSWISRPSMEKVSGSMWARFNSFVAGDDSDAASTGSGKAGEVAEFGPFAHVAGTPTVSRSPSVSDLYGSYPAPAAQPIPAGGSSRYHPSNQYAPNASPEQFRGRSSMDSQRSVSGGLSFGQRRGSQEPSPPVDSQMFPGAAMYGSPGTAAYQPTPPQSSYMPLAPVEEDLSQSPADAVAPAQGPVNGLFYQPPGQDATSAAQSPFYQGPPDMPQSGNMSYMPPAGGTSYEPSSYEPSSYNAPSMDMAPEIEEPSAEDEPKPKKKQFMDDDDDDDLAARAESVQKAQKAENDRKADEAFRKAAEEDGKNLIQGMAVKHYANIRSSQKSVSATVKEGLVRRLVWRWWWWQEGTRQRGRWSHQGQVGRGEFFLLRQGPQEMGQQERSQLQRPSSCHAPSSAWICPFEPSRQLQQYGASSSHVYCFGKSTPIFLERCTASSFVESGVL